MSEPRAAVAGGERGDRDRRLAIGLIALGLGVAANSLLGPLVGGPIRYRFSDTLISQGIGLDAVSLLVIAPLAVGTGILALRGHRAAPVLALGPALYTAYVSAQYAIGPEYLRLPGNNERFFPLHLGLFVLALVLAARAWAEASPESLAPGSPRRDRRLGLLLLGLGALLLLRYLPAVGDLVGGEPTLPEYRENPTSFLLIAWMDLGIFLPAAIAGGLALRRHAGWARKMPYAIVGWFALVGLAVAAMTIVMRVNGDPAVSTGQMVGFIFAALLLVALAIRLYWPLRTHRSQPADHGV